MTKHEPSKHFKPPFTSAERRRWQQDVLSFTRACARLTMLAALSGEPTGVALAEAIQQWTQQAMKPGAHVRCLGCDAVFGPDVQPATYAVALPFADRGHAIVMGACARCAEREDLRQVVQQLLRQVWPDAHNMTGGGGHG